MNTTRHATPKKIYSFETVEEMTQFAQTHLEGVSPEMVEAEVYERALFQHGCFVLMFDPYGLLGEPWKSPEIGDKLGALRDDAIKKISVLTRGKHMFTVMAFHGTEYQQNSEVVILVSSGDFKHTNEEGETQFFNTHDLCADDLVYIADNLKECKPLDGDGNIIEEDDDMEMLAALEIDGEVKTIEELTNPY